MKKYKLKKEFPSSKIGDVWVKADNGFMSPEGRETIKMHKHLFKPFNDWFEDYEEPKEDYIRVIESFINYVEEADDSFYCDESVKKFVEELEAWKRLKEKGFRFLDHLDRDCGQGICRYEWDGYINGEDLDLLFGGGGG